MASYVTKPCVDCGVMYRKRNRPDRVHRCIDCAVARAAEHNRQLSAKNGPAWDAWVKAGPTAAERYARSVL